MVRMRSVTTKGNWEFKYGSKYVANFKIDVIIYHLKINALDPKQELSLDQNQLT